MSQLIYVFIDYGRKDKVRLYKSKKKLIDHYIKIVKASNIEFFNEKPDQLRNETDLKPESREELIRAFEGKVYNENLIDMKEYCYHYDGDSDYMEAYLH